MFVSLPTYNDTLTILRIGLRYRILRLYENTTIFADKLFPAIKM